MKVIYIYCQTTWKTQKFPRKEIKTNSNSNIVNILLNILLVVFFSELSNSDEVLNSEYKGKESQSQDYPTTTMDSKFYAL